MTSSLSLVPITIGTASFYALAVLLAVLVRTPARELFLVFLAGANVIVLASWLRPFDALALGVVLIPTYLAARANWGKNEAAHRWMLVALIAAVVILFLVLRRYPGFDLQGWTAHPVSIIGISYIMFRLIHLLVEAPAATVPLTPMRFFAFATAFWTLLAGPIQRYEDFCSGLARVTQAGPSEVLAPAHRITTGILKAFVLAPIFFEDTKIRPISMEEFNWISWIATFYSSFLFIYLDFSGYTDIVVGVARLCGFNTLPENFDRPYLARNVQEFWGRWHISLGTWFRDYFYTPLFKWLAGLTGFRAFALLNAAALFFTFTAVGLWHGPGLNFLAFGMAQAIGVLTAVLGRDVRRALLSRKCSEAWEQSALVSALSRLLCFHYICATFLLLDNSPATVGDFLVALPTWLWAR
jgi:D-alanyl-lipoteichoic acid acyltransferase DltB (MBOAT superfamily)